MALTWFGAYASALAAEPDQAALERDMCATSKCQHDVRVTLKREDGTLYQRHFDILPATVQAMGMVVISGQTVYIEADMAGDRLVNLMVVDSVAHPEKTLTAKLEQNAEGGMLLTLENPFSKSLKFNMGMMPLRFESWMKTSSCPVRGGGSFLTNTGLSRSFSWFWVTQSFLKRAPARLASTDTPRRAKVECL